MRPASLLIFCLLVLTALPALGQGQAQHGAAGVVSGPMECSPDLPLADRMHCENVRLDAADEALNAAYRELLSLLDERGRERLVEAQRAWLAFRDRDFELRAVVRAGQGQEGLLEQVRFMRALTEERTRALTAMAEDARSLGPPPAPASGKAASGPDREDHADAEPVRAASDKALALLLGPHALRLHWLGEDATGLVTGKMRGRALILSGGQETPKGFVRLDGWVESVTEQAFVLHGRVTTRVEHLGGGAPCVRQGRMEFRRHHGRPFWRLQNHTNPCSGVTDYVDILLAGPGRDTAP